MMQHLHQLVANFTCCLVQETGLMTETDSNQRDEVGCETKTMSWETLTVVRKAAGMWTVSVGLFPTSDTLTLRSIFTFSNLN